MTIAPPRLKDGDGRLAQSLRDYAEAPLPSSPAPVSWPGVSPGSAPGPSRLVWGAGTVVAAVAAALVVWSVTREPTPATIPVQVEAMGPVAVDGVQLGASPLVVRLEPGSHQFSSLGLTVAVEVLREQTVRIPSAEQVLEEARGERDVARALAAYARLENASNAELALYERAMLAFRAGQLDSALTLLTAHRARFPKGALAMEASLSRAEVLVAMSRLSDALDALTTHLEGFGASERRAEVLLLRGEVRRRVGQTELAREDLREAAKEPRFADEATFRLGVLDPDVRAGLEAYLQSFPMGAHAAEVRRALETNP